MRKLLLSIFVAFAATLCASAQYASAPEVFAKNPDQVVPGLKYSKLKKMYDKKDYAYLADPEYGTGRSWLNLLVPGLAQYTMGEGGLGTRYLIFGLIGEGLVSIGFHDMMVEMADLPMEPIVGDGDAWFIPIMFGSLILIPDYIFSIINANKVAKVKSLYDYDLKKLGRQVSFETMPFIAPVRVGDKVQPAAGVTFAMQF